MPGYLRKDRERQDPALVAMRIRKLFGAMLEPAIGGEKRQCGGVVDRGLNAVGAQVRRQRIAARMQNRIEMIDVRAIRRDRGHSDTFDLVEAGGGKLRGSR